MKEILIDPITRLEGHGNVSIFLNDQGEVEKLMSQIKDPVGTFYTYSLPSSILRRKVMKK